MRQIERGEVGGRVVIETDDELGRLAEGFNALSLQLEFSKAQTARKEEQRAQAALQFHEAQKRDALGRLAAGIAHDFNNILAIIMMYSDTVRTRLPEDDRNRKRLDEVLTAANRGKDLISQILDFTRDKATEHVAFDLAENLRETISLLDETVAKEIELSVRVPDGGVWVTGDATGLHQVVANLAINAIHAMPATDAKLDIRLERMVIDGKSIDKLNKKFAGADADVVFDAQEDGVAKAWLRQLSIGRYARISIADNGAGMSLNTLRKVFDPYFTTKPVGEGTGLGLAAVAGITAAHDGGISVETKEGEGTTFHVFVPLPDNEEELKHG
jgi:signal transduction histidine kinase